MVHPFHVKKTVVNIIILYYRIFLTPRSTRRGSSAGTKEVNPTIPPPFFLRSDMNSSHQADSQQSRRRRPPVHWFRRRKRGRDFFRWECCSGELLFLEISELIREIMFGYLFHESPGISKRVNYTKIIVQTEGGFKQGPYI